MSSLISSGLPPGRRTSESPRESQEKRVRWLDQVQTQDTPDRQHWQSVDTPVVSGSQNADESLSIRMRRRSHRLGGRLKEVLQRLTASSKLRIDDDRRQVFLQYVEARYGKDEVDFIRSNLGDDRLSSKRAKELRTLADRRETARRFADAIDHHPLRELQVNAKQISNFVVPIDGLRKAVVAGGQLMRTKSMSRHFAEVGGYLNSIAGGSRPGAQLSHETENSSLGKLGQALSYIVEHSKQIERVHDGMGKSALQRWTTLTGNDGAIDPMLARAFPAQMVASVKLAEVALEDALPARWAQLTNQEKNALGYAAAEWVTVLNKRIEDAKTFAKIYGDQDFQKHFSKKDRETVLKLGDAYKNVAAIMLDPAGEFQQSMAFAIVLVAARKRAAKTISTDTQ